jgi:hypothetical protein
MNYFVVGTWLILTAVILCYVFDVFACAQSRHTHKTHKPTIAIPESPTMTPKAFHMNEYAPIMMDDGFQKKHLV